MLPFHPIADIFPLMEGDEFDELVGDIKRRGLKFPIWMFEGMVLDGRNRVRACAKAGYELKDTDIKQFEGTREEAIRFVISANIHRRHFKTPDDRRKYLKTLIEMNPNLSDRAIAAMAMTHHHAVANAREEQEANGKNSHKNRVEKSGRRARGRKPGSKPKSPARQISPEIPTPSEKLTSDLPTGSTNTENPTQQIDVAETSTEPNPVSVWIDRIGEAWNRATNPFASSCENPITTAWGKATDEQRGEFAFAHIELIAEWLADFKRDTQGDPSRYCIYQSCRTIEDGLNELEDDTFDEASSEYELLADQLSKLERRVNDAVAENEKREGNHE
jgi:ParB-like chromosome segregation protein Spo0J